MTSSLVPTLAHIYRFEEDNVGQSVWDKEKCYWGTHWELNGNALGTKKFKNLSTHDPQKEICLGHGVMRGHGGGACS